MNIQDPILKSGYANTGSSPMNVITGSSAIDGAATPALMQNKYKDAQEFSLNPKSVKKDDESSTGARPHYPLQDLSPIPSLLEQQG